MALHCSQGYISRTTSMPAALPMGSISSRYGGTIFSCSALLHVKLGCCSAIWLQLLQAALRFGA